MIIIIIIIIITIIIATIIIIITTLIVITIISIIIPADCSVISVEENLEPNTKWLLGVDLSHLAEDQEVKVEQGKPPASSFCD